MKFALLFLTVLPFVFSAHVNERFIESFLGNYDGKKDYTMTCVFPSFQYMHTYT